MKITYLTKKNNLEITLGQNWP